MFYKPDVATTKIATWTNPGAIPPGGTGTPTNIIKDIYIKLNPMSVQDCTITVAITPGATPPTYTYGVTATCDITNIGATSNWLKMVQTLDGSNTTPTALTYLSPFVLVKGNGCGILKSPATFLKFSIAVTGNVLYDFSAVITVYQPDLRVI